MDGAVWVVELHDNNNKFEVSPTKIISTKIFEDSNIITSLDFSPDGKYILSADESNDIRVTVFPLEGRPLQKQSVCHGHSDFITCIAFVSNLGSEYLLSGSRDSTVRLWDMTSGENISTYEGKVPITDMCTVNSVAAVQSFQGILLLSCDISARTLSFNKVINFESFIPTSIALSKALIWMVSGVSQPPSTNQTGVSRVRAFSRDGEIHRDWEIPLLDHLQVGLIGDQDLLEYAKKCLEEEAETLKTINFHKNKKRRRRHAKRQPIVTKLPELMGKEAKKKARTPTKENVSDKSCATGEVAEGVVKACVHFDKADLDKVLDKIKSSRQIKCQECKKGVHHKRGAKAKGNKGEPAFPFSDPKSDKKAIWVCLECGCYVCGDVGLPTGAQSHVMRHFRSTRHRFVIQWENPLLKWCFPCNSLLPVKKEENGEKRKE